jgi:phage terminase large subunit-like protein
VDGQEHFYMFGRHYLPEVRIDDPDRRHYQGWVVDGHLTSTEGDIIDHDEIRADIVADASSYQIRQVGYDPYNATQLAVQLSASGIPTLEIPQTTAHLSDPMKWVEALVLAGRFHHDGNPCMSWMMSNVTARVDAKDNVFPRKERLENKIDGPVALIIAMAVAMREPDKPKLPGILTL